MGTTSAEGVPDVDLMQPTPPEEIAPAEAAIPAAQPSEVPPATNSPDPNQIVSRRKNEQLIRRIRWIAATGFAAFFAVVWLFLRAVAPSAPSGRDPLQVVRAEISALDRGDLQTAYAQLSKHYRETVPFNTYHMLVISHRRVFLTRKYALSLQERHGSSQMLVVAELETEAGAHYTAKFTLVRDGGRWWIDDLHWQAASQEETRT